MELLSSREVKIPVTQMIGTQGVCWCQCVDTALPMPGSQEKQGLCFLFSELGEGMVCACLSLEERDQSGFEVGERKSMGRDTGRWQREAGAGGGLWGRSCLSGRGGPLPPPRQGPQDPD